MHARLRGNVHPQVRLVSLLAFAVFVPWLPPTGMIVIAILLGPATVRNANVLRGVLQGLRRVRWLILAIALLYLWSVPGEPLWNSAGALSPTRAGVALALTRAGTLTLMVWAAAAVLAVTPAPVVSAALRGLLRGPLHTPVTMRFADRIGLLLAELPVMQERVALAMRSPAGGLAARAALLVSEVERRAADASIEPQPPLSLGPVPRWQWLMPATIAIGCTFLILVG